MGYWTALRREIRCGADWDCRVPAGAPVYVVQIARPAELDPARPIILVPIERRRCQQHAWQPVDLEAVEAARALIATEDAARAAEPQAPEMTLATARPTWRRPRRDGFAQLADVALDRRLPVGDRE